MQNLPSWRVYLPASPWEFV